jgi:hypothetical protein
VFSGNCFFNPPNPPLVTDWHFSAGDPQNRRISLVTPIVGRLAANSDSALAHFGLAGNY